MEKSLTETAIGDHMDVQGLCITSPIPHWIRHSGELATSLTSSSTLENRSSLTSHSGASFGVRDVGMVASRT